MFNDTIKSLAKLFFHEFFGNTRISWRIKIEFLKKFFNKDPRDSYLLHISKLKEQCSKKEMILLKKMLSKFSKGYTKCYTQRDLIKVVSELESTLGDGTEVIPVLSKEWKQRQKI